MSQLTINVEGVTIGLQDFNLRDFSVTFIDWSMKMDAHADAHVVHVMQLQTLEDSLDMFSAAGYATRRRSIDFIYQLEKIKISRQKRGHKLNVHSVERLEARMAEAKVELRAAEGNDVVTVGAARQGEGGRRYAAVIDLTRASEGAGDGGHDARSARAPRPAYVEDDDDEGGAI